MKSKLVFNELRYGNWVLGNGEYYRIETIARFVGKHKTILDIGCGIGQIGQRLLKDNNLVYGIDIAKGAVTQAIKNGIKAKYCDIDTQEIPFKAKFDTIVAAEVIEHVYDTSLFLQKIAKKLKRDGTLIITTPNVAALGRRLLLFFGKNPHIEVDFSEGTAGHLRYFTYDTLYSLLDRNGYKVTDFSSDIVNFNASGTVFSRKFAEILPRFGRSLIIKAVKL